MDKMSISDETTEELLTNNGPVQFTYGVNSPYPGDNQAPVPAASFQLGGDKQANLYRMDNVARIEHNRAGRSEPDFVFGGRFSTTSDANISSMTIAHQSNELNKDIVGWPILKVADNWGGKDTSNGRRTIVGALRHWYAECGLTEFGVRGDFLFNTSNHLPGVAYYDHPSMRFIPWYDDSPNVPGNYSAILWERTKPVAVDQGAPLGVGDKVTIALKPNNVYGDPAYGEATPQSSSWVAFFDFASGKIRPGINDENVNSIARIGIEWVYASHTIKIVERNETDSTENVVSVVDKLPGMEDAPRMVTLTMTRLSATNIEMYIQFFHRTGVSEFTYTSTVNLLPTSVALTRVIASAILNDSATPVLSHEGILGVYIVKGDTFTYHDEDAYPIDVAYFNKPKWKNIAFPAISGNAWTMIHEMCSVFGFEFHPLHNTFKLLGSNEPATALVTGEGSQVVVQANTREMAETIEVVNYNYTKSQLWDNNIALYKADQVYSVALGERIEETVTLDEGSGYLTLSTPVCVRVSEAIKYWNAPKNYAMASIYSVYDDDNLEVDPNSWVDGGGFISLERGSASNEIKVIIQAPNNDLISKEGTFHISIAGADIPSLIIAGNGLKAEKETLRVKTGAGKSRNLKVLGETYDNPLVSSNGIAWDVGARLASRYGTTRTTASGTFPPVKVHNFPVTPVLKGGSFFKPTNMSDNSLSLGVSEAVRYNPVKWVQDNFRGLTCEEYQERWPSNALCREVNLSPLGSRGAHF